MSVINLSLSTELYNEIVKNNVKLHLIEKAVAEDNNRYDSFFNSLTVEKIRFILGKEKQNESESAEANENE